MKVLFATIAALVSFIMWLGYPAMGKELGHLNIRVVDISASGQITVEISNPSDAPVRIWEDSNSWGAARWRVLLL